MVGFVEHAFDKQPWLQLVIPGETMPWDIRFFLRGSLLDQTQGDADIMRNRLSPILGKRFPLMAPKQVHETRALKGYLHEFLPYRPAADGVLLTAHEQEASLRFADCAPVVVASKENRWLLLLHSGYKGTVRNIVGDALTPLIQTYGVSAMRSAYAWVGPCIRRDHYPRDTTDEWSQKGLACFAPENTLLKGEKTYFDIPGQILAQLKDCGLQQERIFDIGIDTLDSRAFCYSYRGGDLEDRMFLWARFSEK